MSNLAERLAEAEVNPYSPGSVDIPDDLVIERRKLLIQRRRELYFTGKLDKDLVCESCGSVGAYRFKGGPLCLECGKRICWTCERIIAVWEPLFDELRKDGRYWV